MTKMTSKEWIGQINDWSEVFELKTRKPVPISEQTRSILTGSPDDLIALYEATNGMRSDWFNILPIHSSEDIKNTWDSLNRANDPSTSRFLGGDSEMLTRFLVFAEIGGGHCACIDRNDGSIWFEDEDGISQTDLEIKEFIETMLREVEEL